MAEAMLAVGSASQLEFCTRAAAVEVLLSLAERAPAIMRKCPSVSPNVLPLVLALTCEVRKDYEVLCPQKYCLDGTYVKKSDE